MKTRRWRSSMAEQLICNQQVAGSIPPASSAISATPDTMKPDSMPAGWLADTCGIGTTEGFPSGQREQTVNLSPLASKVRILPPPPKERMDRISEGIATVWRHAGVAQLVELQPSKLDVAGSNPVSRSRASLQTMRAKYEEERGFHGRTRVDNRVHVAHVAQSVRARPW